MPKDAPDLLTTAQAAEILGRRTQTVLNLVRGKKLAPAGKLPTATGTYLFHRADVEALLPPPAEDAA